MTNTVPKGDFVVVLKVGYFSSSTSRVSLGVSNVRYPQRALRDKETRELVAKELALYDTKEGQSGESTVGNIPAHMNVNHAFSLEDAQSRTPKTKQEDETERLLAEFARVSLEERVLDLEKTVAKQQAKIKAQGEDIVKLWELMEGEISGHHGALAAFLSSQPEFRIHSSGEDDGDSDKNEEERRDRPVQTARKGKPQTARRSRPWPRARGGRNS
ncbi:hypothetical protein FRC06_009657 [Ceratobasidium sp. 370]|nr:hypothetical protein FRC06_009657 [Ceratobasidium sp. 370]